MRRRVRELRADHHRVASAPYPSSYAKREWQQITQLAATRRSSVVSPVIEHGREIVVQTQRVTSEVHGERRALGFAEIPDASLCLLDPQRSSHREAQCRDRRRSRRRKCAVEHEVRQKAEAEIAGDLLDIERQEATFVWSAQAQGLPIEFRADCSRSRILGVNARRDRAPAQQQKLRRGTHGRCGDEIVQVAGDVRPGRSARGAGRPVKQPLPAPNPRAAWLAPNRRAESRHQRRGAGSGGGTVSCKKSRLSHFMASFRTRRKPPRAATGALNGAARYPHSPRPGKRAQRGPVEADESLGCRILASADAIDAPRLKNQALGRGAKPPKRQRSQMRRIPLHDQGERGRQVSPARCAAE